MNMIPFVLFLYLLHFVSCENKPPTIFEISPTLIKDVNDSVTLVCKVDDLQDYIIGWSKQGTKNLISLASDEKTIVRDSRIKVSLEKSSFVEYRLTIANVQPKDAGEYHCSITLDTNADVSKQVTLQVRSPPYISGDPSTTIITNINTSTKLECYPYGYPAPVVIWTRENDALLPNGNTVYNGSKLIIDKVQKDHAGVYYCHADNKVGSSVKKPYTLIVHYAPVVKAVRDRVGQAIGFTTQLEWKIDSSPAPVITWYKDNALISNNQYYETSQKAIDDQYTALLKVQIAEARLYGIYTCKVNNTIGVNHANIELYQTSEKQCAGQVCDSSGHSIVTFLDFKLSFTSVIILMLNWQIM